MLRISLTPYTGLIPEIEVDFTIIVCGDVTSLTPPIVDWKGFEDYDIDEGEEEIISIGLYERVGDDVYTCIETLTFDPPLEDFTWIR